MSAVSGRRVKERRIIDVNAVRGDLIPAQLEHIGERHRDGGAIMARVGHYPLAGYRRPIAPGQGAQQTVTARSDRREKLSRCYPDRLGACDRRCTAERELRIGRQKVNECGRVASVNGRKQPTPPGLIRFKDTLCCDCHLQSILDPISTCLSKDR
jgi:hypothetical protein